MTSNAPRRLPRFDEWRDGFGGSVGIWDYAAQKGGLTMALAFASLFWPELIDVDGSVFLAERFDASAYAQWRSQLGDRPEAIERTMNHVHLWDLFQPEREEVPAGELDRLAEIMAETWRVALARQFPERSGQVLLESGDEDYGPTLTLFTSHG